MQEIIIVGGGLAGLISALLLKKAGHDVLLIEKKKYPFHRVCGEYISNEVRPFLEKHDLFPQKINPAKINTFRLTSTKGKQADISLDMGGFGISRYAFDYFLYKKANDLGVEILEESRVNDIQFTPGKKGKFKIHLSTGHHLESLIVVGAYGKRSKVDKTLKRSFIQKSSPYVGIKYHVKHDHAEHTVALHNFKGGYCGINKVENGVSNLCYLTKRENLKAHGSIPAVEKAVLAQNPHLKKIFSEAEFLFDRPEVINEISFETKEPIENHILMCGDAAGMIAPLCGNGMAMAIHSAKILSDAVIEALAQTDFDRSSLEQTYEQKWKYLFARRLTMGRHLQNLFGSGWLSGLSVGLVKTIKPAAHFLIEKTHGKPF